MLSDATDADATPPAPVPRDSALSYYQASAELGNARAQHNLGVLYRDGLGVERNEAEALTWFQKSADQGYAKAQLNLGQLFEKLAGQKK